MYITYNRSNTYVTVLAFQNFHSYSTKAEAHSLVDLRENRNFDRLADVKSLVL